MRRQVIQMLSLALAGCMVLGMTACGSKSSTGTAAPESKQDVTTEGSSAGTAAEKPDKTAEEASLVMLIEEPNVNYYPVFLENIRAKYPEYSITSKTWDQSQVEKTVKTAFAGGEAVDIVKWFPNQMETFISSDMALDLTPYMDDEWKSIFTENALDIGTYGGKLFCLPITTVYPDIDVNVDIFEEAGVEVKEHWTWDEFVAACEKIKQNTDVFPFAICDTRVGWFQRNAFLQIWDTKEELEAFNRGEISFKDERVVTALDKINDLFAKEYAYPGNGAFSQTKDQTKAAFSQGKIAMLFNVNNGGKTIRTVMEEAGRTNIRTISWPTMAAGECDYVLGGCDGYFISSNTKNPEASINILKYLTSKEAFELLVDDGDVVPANVEGGTDEEFARDSSKVYPKEIMAISAEMNDYINYNIGANYFYDKEGTLEELESLRTSAQ